MFRAFPARVDFLFYIYTMKLKEAVEILESTISGGRDNDNKYEMADPKKQGIAIDTVVRFIKEGFERY